MEDFTARGLNNLAYHYDKQQYEKIGITDEQKIEQLEHRKTKEMVDRIGMSLNLVDQYSSVYILKEDLMRYIAMNHTPPKDIIKKLKLPFKCIFIETEITRNDFPDLSVDVISGILVCETEFISSVDADAGELKYNNLGRCFLVYYFCNDNQRYWIDEFKIAVDELDGGIKILYRDNGMQRFLKSFLMNYILFINDPETEEVFHTRDEKNVSRRMKQGKMVLPSSRTIRVVGKLKIYMDNLRAGLSGSHYNFSFYVAGHYRTLRSSRYKAKRGAIIRLEPYLKGSGVLLKRTYELDFEKNDNRRRDLEREEEGRNIISPTKVGSFR
jgi:hypothetical protein